MFLVSRQTDDGVKPIGTVSLTRGIPPGPLHLAPDIRFAMLPEECRKGYATEAANALLEYANKNLGVGTMFGFCSPANQWGRGALETIGMECRGVKPLKVFGGEDSAVYGFPGTSDDLIYNLD